MKSPLKVIKHSYHRNGISGLGFYVIIFDWFETGDNHTNMCAFVFEETGTVAVTQINELNKHNIEMAMGNSWRGDHFEGELRKFIEKQQKKSLKKISKVI